MALSKIAVFVASLGRPDNLRALLERLTVQTVPPAQVVLSLEKPEDCPRTDDIPLAVEIIYGPRGLTRQRNRALDRMAPDIDIVMFCDDDYVPSRFALEGVLNTFAAYPDAQGVTGRLLFDGAKGPGMPPAEATQRVDAEDARHSAAPPPTYRRPINGLYGCNMAMRVSAIGDTRFDEALPLYGWLEDTDFTLRVSHALIETDGFYGVHCAEKGGREKIGVRLGYMQVANAIYLYRKGSIRLSRLVGLLYRPVLTNHVRILSPEPWIDRAGRARGNRDALIDLARGRCEPGRILSY